MKSVKPILTIQVNWSEYKPNCGHPAQVLLDKIYAKLQQIKNEEPSLVEAQFEEGTCNYIYYACGSCGGNGSLVEAYCNGGGGSKPDYSWCEEC